MYKFPKKINGFKIKNQEKVILKTVIMKNVLCCYTKTNKIIAYLKWKVVDDFVISIEVKVEEEYRRQGIAENMYNAIRKATKKKLKWTYPLNSPNIERFVQKYKLINKCQIKIENDDVLIFNEL